MDTSSEGVHAEQAEAGPRIQVVLIGAGEANCVICAFPTPDHVTRTKFARVSRVLVVLGGAVLLSVDRVGSAIPLIEENIVILNSCNKPLTIIRKINRINIRVHLRKQLQIAIEGLLFTAIIDIDILLLNSERKESTILTPIHCLSSNVITD